MMLLSNVHLRLGACLLFWAASHVLASPTEIEKLKERVQILEEAVFPGPTCPSGWVRFKSSCYGIGAEPVSWGAAQASCALFGATLAEIEDSAENEFLKGIGKARNYGCPWLGATDTFSDGHWVWASSQTPLGEGFTDWNTGEPNNHRGREDCLCLGPRYGWNDQQCESHQQYFCEMRLAE